MEENEIIKETESKCKEELHKIRKIFALTQNVIDIFYKEHESLDEIEQVSLYFFSKNLYLFNYSFEHSIKGQYTASMLLLRPIFENTYLLRLFSENPRKFKKWKQFRIDIDPIEKMLYSLDGITNETEWSQNSILQKQLLNQNKEFSMGQILVNISTSSDAVNRNFRQIYHYLSGYTHPDLPKIGEFLLQNNKGGYVLTYTPSFDKRSFQNFYLCFILLMSTFVKFFNRITREKCKNISYKKAIKNFGIETNKQLKLLKKKK